MSGTTEGSALRAILGVADATPEQLLAAALLRSAIEEVQAGDREAWVWLRHCAPVYLEILAPPDIDPRVLHAELLCRLPPAPSLPLQLALDPGLDGARRAVRRRRAGTASVARTRRNDPVQARLPLTEAIG